MRTKQSNQKTKPWGLFITKVILKTDVENPEEYLKSLGIRSIIIGDMGLFWRVYAWHFKTAAQALINDHDFTFCEAGQMPS